MTQLFVDAARSRLASSLSKSDTSISVVDGSLFPVANVGTGALSSGNWFKLVIQDGGEIEIVYVRSHSAGSASLTNVLRGQEGTSARAFSKDSVVGIRLTAQDATELLAHSESQNNPHNITKTTIGLDNVDNTADISKPISNAMFNALGDKVDKVVGKALSDENFTLSEKQKLAGLESSRYKGLFTSLGNLQSSVASPAAGDYADVDPGSSTDVERYIWDASDSKWVKQLGEATALTAAQVKSLYESNADTNAFTDNEKTKLSNAAADADVLKKANNLSDLSNAGTARGNLGGTTVGQALFTVTNPSAIRFIRINAANTVSMRTAAEIRSDIGIGSMATRDVTISSGDPSGGSNGDVHYKVS